MRELKIGIRLALLLAALTGVVYPLVVTGLAHALFPQQASGSLVRQGGVVVGSRFLGQQFQRPEYFHGRPSAAGNGYDPLNSGGSNLASTNQKLLQAVEDNVRAAGGPSGGPVPVDLVTASGSGLDPDISVASAFYQVPRVAEARHMDQEDLRRLVSSYTVGPQFGILGERRVNVVELNLALDSLRK